MKQRQAAFTLFEVMIAVVILSIGLLGLASLQAAGMRSNNTAYMRSQASVLAYDMADRMRANRQGNYLATANEQAACLTTAGCTTDEMAQNDISEWDAAITDTLPEGTGTITLSGTVYTIKVLWDDNRDGNADIADPDFSTSFML